MKTVLFALGVSLAAAVASAGQQSDAAYQIEAAGSSQAQPSAGWNLTPALLMSRMFDDNVLLRGPGDPQEHDYINVVNPRGDLTYHGRRSDFSVHYDGAFVVYNQLDTLNSFEQRGGLSLKHRASKRNTFFVTSSLAASPTTELLQLSGIPYVRAGTLTNDTRAGVESLLSKTTSATFEAHFQEVRFDASQTYANLLLGGHSIGGDASLRHRLSERTTLTASADFQHASIGAAEQVFDVQHAMAGVEQRLARDTRVYVSGGISRLSVTQYGPARTGPSWSLGLEQHYRSTVIDLSFNRSFVPSFGFGGTMQNEDVTARVRLPLTRRIYTQGLASWSRQDPLAVEVPQLRSSWLEGSVGYAARPWFRIEAFVASTRQTAGRPDALLEHTQYGVQVIASKPVRFR
jgi:hypothetical protein